VACGLYCAGATGGGRELDASPKTKQPRLVPLAYDPYTVDAHFGTSHSTNSGTYLLRKNQKISQVDLAQA